MIYHNDYYEQVDELFKKLDSNNLLVPFTDNSDIDEISRRNNSTMHISEMKYMILTDEGFFKKYKNFWIPFEVTEFDLYNDFIQQGATYILGLFEMFKKFLLMILDTKKLEINDRSTLGNIFHAISKTPKFEKKKLENLFMLEVRNMIAHDNWYFEEKNFCYKENGVVKKLNLDEFVQLIVDVTDVTNAVYLQWGQYMPRLEFERRKKNMK